MEHVDEQGQPCAHHPALSLDLLMSLATVGSRAAGFHHDIASKLHGLMMMLDEIREGLEGLAGVDPQLMSATEAAVEAVHELHKLLDTNRALTKPPHPARVSLGEIVARASARVHVTIQGEIPETLLEVSATSVVHGLSLVFDVAAGAGRGRTISVGTEISNGQIVMTLKASPSLPANAAASLAIATFVFARERGELSCADAGKQLVIRIPVTS